LSFTLFSPIITPNNTITSVHSFTRKEIMSRFKRVIKYGTVSGTAVGSIFLMMSAGMHIAGPDTPRPLQDQSEKIGGGTPTWSFVGMLTGTGFGIGFVLGGIYGACSYDPPYNPPVLAAPLLAGQGDNIADAIVNVQPEGVPAEQAGNSPDNGRVSPLGRLNFLARPGTPPVQAVTVQPIVHSDHEIELPAYR
jgi:hypothetical protein